MHVPKTRPGDTRPDTRVEGKEEEKTDIGPQGGGRILDIRSLYSLADILGHNLAVSVNELDFTHNSARINPSRNLSPFLIRPMFSPQKGRCGLSKSGDVRNSKCDRRSQAGLETGLHNGEGDSDRG